MTANAMMMILTRLTADSSCRGASGSEPFNKAVILRVLAAGVNARRPRRALCLQRITSGARPRFRPPEARLTARPRYA